MDKNLLVLWQSVFSGNVKQEEIAELLQLSPRQTSRSIKKWAEQGWFTYSSGQGRGNSSKLQWLRNVEQVYEEQLMKMIGEDAIEKSSKYLLYDWSNEAKDRLMNLFQSKFGYVQSPDEQDKLIIPRRYPLLTMHPLETAEVQGAHIVTNVFNRLVAVDSNGNVFPELAHSWDIEPGKLRFYLKKDVKFHDGSILTAHDVAECLEKLRSHAQFKDLWRPITEISSVAPLVVDILFPGGCSYCLQMLGMMNASIYKEQNGKLIGTGSFYVEGEIKPRLTLMAFKEHFQERPLLDAVEFVVVPADFDFAYRSATEEQAQKTFQVESDSGFGIVIMNAFRDSDIRRKEVRDFIHSIIAKYRHELGAVEQRITPNSRSCLAGQDQQYIPPEIPLPVFTKPLVLKTTNYVANTSAWLKDILEKEGVPVEMLELPFEEYTFNREKNQHADLFIHGEIFEMNQNFSFFQFLIYGYSPLAPLVNTDKKLDRYINDYKHTPFAEWTALNLKVEKALIESSVLIPLYYVKRQIPFSTDLIHINISHFGYVDFSKLWIRPQ
ncbi:MarR-like DNA-binding transcriptional regulator SgrR of sgrS sRNA [Planomicrobium soli]|uniref:MarR-like DNA-binding transcriptional regulator SgrR of sgrS sRNA n=1 Tax=Planomicrobium soli TaxID=1176648 RepID=A0A2P8H6E6_9BACL|nr:ABC transporter substrate-binding protein [Planomicrobium soli]PSL41770.1 MarR-like DNA-binding transcriptional regulator SgrR of sgrS sRNA [Planomicrobium soli]